MDEDGAVVIFSGGQDSTTCLYWALERFPKEKILALSFDYGQRHAIELACGQQIAEAVGVEREVIQLGNVFEGTSPLVNSAEAVPVYENYHHLPKEREPEPTFVLGRNALFLSIAANRAASRGYHYVVIGVSQADFGGYPDCRDMFLRQMQKALNLGLGDTVEAIDIVAPLLKLTKAQTVRVAQDLPGCMAGLAFSHTCYQGVFPPCGQCHACLIRARGFSEAGVKDPLITRVNDLARKPVEAEAAAAAGEEGGN